MENGEPEAAPKVVISLYPPAPPPAPIFVPPDPPPAIINKVIVPDGGGLGTALLDAALAGPVPPALVAVTVNVYVVPLLSPVMMTGEAVFVPVAPPGEAVAV
jgi:hypothetical protein